MAASLEELKRTYYGAALGILEPTLSGASLAELEQAFFSTTPGSGGSGSSTAVNQLGNLGASVTLANLTSYGTQVGTLTANTAITLPAAAIGTAFILKLDEDVTGGRTPTFVPTGADQIAYPAGAIVFVTTANAENMVSVSCDTTGLWDIVPITGGGALGAPIGGSYVTMVTESGLSAETLLSAAISEGTLAARNALTPVGGQLFTTTDEMGRVTYRYNGSAWRALGAANRRAQRPSGAIAETLARNGNGPIGNVSPLTTGQLVLTAIELYEGQSLSTISFVSATTAASVPLNQWFNLCDKNRVELAVTADDTTTAWAASSVKTLTIASGPYVVPATDMYYVGIMVLATTVPSLAGYTAIAAAIGSIAPILSGKSNSAQTTPMTVGTTANALTATSTSIPYAWVA